MYHRPPHLVRRIRTPGSAAVLFTLLAGCGSDGTSPVDSQQRIRLLDGDEQTAVAGETLAQPLRVQVTEVSSGSPLAGVSVRWSVSMGAGASLTPQTSTTDASGVAQTSLRLGTQPGAYRVAASTLGAPGVATFGATALEPLTLNTVAPTHIVAGGSIELGGTGFDQNAEPRVLFSGIPGTVTEIRGDRLSVDVPPCLPNRDVGVRVVQGGRSSGIVHLSVSGQGTAVDLGPGEDLILSDTPLLRCRRLALASGGEYVVVVRSDDVRGGRTHTYSLRGLGPTGEIVAESRGTVAPYVASDPSYPAPGQVQSPQGAWHDYVRGLEAHHARSASATGTGLERSAVPPQPGETAQFSVLTGGGGVDTVQAVARYVGQHAAVYEDVRAPAGGLLAADFEALAREFDDPIYDVVTGVFGAPSDVDQNDRVVILFTPAVNRLTPRGSDAFVAGFFFGGDLLSSGGNAPRGEVFYALVPDPTGEYSDPVDRSLVVTGIPAVLAHEFQHMVHFNTRVIEGGAPQPEALWLSEALAQMAEDLVFEQVAISGDRVRAGEYRQGNLERGRRYLQDTGSVGLTVATGAGTLPERGAGWLFARYLTDHFGGSRVLTDIARGSRLGVENVVAATGEPWTRTFSDWTVALALDDTGVGPFRFSFPSVSLSSLAGGAGSTLVEGGLDGTTFERSGSLSSASARYLAIEGTQDRELSVTLTGVAGAALDPAAELNVRIVRRR